MTESDMNYQTRKCARCGKEFIFHDEWVYRSGPGDNARLFCSWSCLQAWRNGRGNKYERREKIVQALKDGLTMREVVALLGEEPGTVRYWKLKLEEEQKDAGPG